MLGQTVTVQVRHLGRRPDGERIVAAIVIHYKAARFERYRGNTVVVEFFAEEMVGSGEDFVEAFGLESVVEVDVGADLLVDQRRFRCQRFLYRRYGAEGFVIDLDEIDGVFGRVRVFREYDGNDLANVANPIGSDDGPVGRLETGPIVVGAHRFDVVPDIGRGYHRDDAGNGRGSLRIDRADQTMRNGAPHEAEVQGLRRLGHIVEETAEATQQAIVLNPENRFTDITMVGLSHSGRLRSWLRRWRLSISNPHQGT